MVFVYIVLIVIVVMAILAVIKKPGSIYKNQPEEQNPMQGKKVRFVENEKALYMRCMLSGLLILFFLFVVL